MRQIQIQIHPRNDEMKVEMYFH